MKPSFLTLSFLCAFILPLYAQTATNDVETDIANKNVKLIVESYSYAAFSPVNIFTEGLSLTADSGSLKHDISINLTKIPHKGGYVMPSNMENVCWMSEGVRLLPNGEHFSDTAPALISLAYDPTRIPMGYKQTDVYTYFNDGTQGWHRLERVSVDTVHHVVTSYTTHFTDFANAVIKVPDMPESKAYVPTAMTDLPDANPMKGIPMVEVPTANNRGTAELTYPIELPQGRHSMQPNVDLHYSSAGGNGVLGVGWSLNTPAITIDTRWGVPRFDPRFETEQYLVNGAAVLFRESDGTAKEMPYQTNSYLPRENENSVTRFYARDTKNQDRIIRYGTNPTNYWWAVTDRNGVTTYYGRIFDPTNPGNERIQESSVVKTDSGCIAYWAATASVDVYGNYILYKNEKIGNNIYIESIDYTGNYIQKVPALYRVLLNYKDGRLDVSSNGRLGVLQTEHRLLCNIVVQHLYPKNPDESEYADNLAAYYMQYNQPNEASIFKSRLEEVVMLDSVHYISSKEFDDCNLEKIMHGEVHLNKLLRERMIEAERNHDLELFRQLREMMNQPYGEKSIPASVTKFSYADAPSLNSLFGETKRFNPEKNYLSNSHSNSWSVGGTATVGLGIVVPLTTSSAGANYDFSKSEGRSTSMLMDLDGDGLTDIVYEDILHGKVYYCKQEKKGATYSFREGQIVPGLTRLSHEVTKTHTWGLQLSILANLSYNNPISNTYTDVYFSDINADGLPDMIDGDRILINQLNNGVPTFGPFTGVESQKIVVHNSHCEKGIIFDGEVDEHIECDLQEILIDSYPLEDYSGNHGIEPEKVEDKDIPYPEMKYTDYGVYTPKEQQETFDDIDEFTSKTPEIPIPKRLAKTKSGDNLSTSDDSLIYRIENGRVNVYKLEYICKPVKTDPDIEIVRVWVAGWSGDIELKDTISLVSDASQSREHSRTADGVSYTIQRCHGVREQDNMHLEADDYTILHQGAIGADDDSIHIWSNIFHVEEGDVLMFRLRSGENNLYDKTIWHHVIKYNESQVYDSEKDYICTGDGYFQALNAGKIILSISGSNDGAVPVELRVLKNGESIRNESVTHGSVNIQIEDSVQSNDNIFIQLSYNGEEPRWSDVHLVPKLQYISYFPTDNNDVCDTVIYYPDVQIQEYTSFIENKSSPYRKLFGTLHKGWGEFAYQKDSLDNDTIILNSLVNTQLLAAEQIKNDSTSFKNYDPNIPSLESIDVMDEDDLLAQVNSAFSSDIIYNPISKNNRWIPMRADSRTEQYIAYGNLGCIGKNVHSNAREITSPEIDGEPVEDIVEYDSSIPFTRGESRKNNFVLKQTRTIQHNISGGLPYPIPINKSVSFGTYDVVVDYMDMNGDGYPDFVGKEGIQYSQPWGGIGRLQTVKNFSPFKSKNLATGDAFSACPVELKKMAGNNVKDGRFFMNATYGGSNGRGTSSTKISYIDVNADGLPDKVDLKNNEVYYNLGYSFSSPYPFNNNIISEGSNENASGSISTPPFSIGQVSISGGVGVSISTDWTQSTLIDINGDGLPDCVRSLPLPGINQLQVDYNRSSGTNGISFISNSEHLSNIFVGKNLTENASATVSATGGFTIFGIKICLGLQSSPYTTSFSQGQAMLTDMNGDGLVDYVYKDIVKNEICVRYNRTGNANLLTTVINPTGQKIELTYRLSEPSVNHRSLQWELVEVVDSIANHPMRAAQSNIIEIQYDSAYYDNYEKTDYGYAHVRIVLNKEKVKDEYYYNTSFLQNGELREDLLTDNNGNKYIRNIHGLRYRDIVSGDEHNGENGCDDANTRVAEDGYWTEYYEKEKDPQIVTRYTVQYDELHNMVEYAEYGDVSVPDDDWRQEVTYLPNTANNMISLPKEERVFGAGQLLRSAFVNYSGYGEPAHINFEDNNQGIVATTHLRYDNFGNIVAIIAPEDVNNENNWSAFEYDSVTFSNVVAIYNPFKAITRTEYDYSWGVPIRTIDPDGNEMRFKYDYKGRLSTVLSPIELEHGKEYTVKYEYNLINHNLKMPVKYPYTYVVKDMFDSLFVQRQVAIYDGYGRMMQKKHFAEVNGQDEWVVDGTEEWDAFGRAIMQGYPFVAQKNPHEYEPMNNTQAIIHYVYDVLDRPVEQTNADGKQKTMYYHFYKDMKGVNRFLTQVTDENKIIISTLKSPQNWLIQQVAGDQSITFFEYSPIGELLRTTDAEGYQTTYKYDMLGRLICRTHPDAGKTRMKYDLAGNLIGKQTANLGVTGEEIKYIYKDGRLMEIQYPHHKDNNVQFLYDLAGRLSLRQDGTGSEEFVYDKLGNVAQSVRRIVIPTENQAYVFRTLFKYDSFGRMRNIIYPDGEVVHYGYTTGGLLKNVVGLKQGQQNIYLWDRLYDEQGRKIFQQEGNGVWTTYTYDSQRQWLNHLYTELPSGDALQDLQYNYDPVGNIMDIDQSASSPAGTKLGGPYDNHYIYDKQYRLEQSNGVGTFPYTLNASYSPAGRLGNKSTSAPSLKSDLLFGYNQMHMTHQPRTLFDPHVGTLELYWDANGNLAQMIGCKQNSGRLHEWDEENRLRFVLGERFAGYYGYDANGERVYKLTGISSIGQVNSGSTKAQAIFDDAVLYPNPYVVVTSKGYTKHYYAGTERIATVIGTGGFDDMVTTIDKLRSPHDQDIVKTFYSYYQNYDPFFYQKIVSQPEKTEDILGKTSPDLDYQCKPTELVMVDILNPQDILLKSISVNEQNNGPEKEVYFYHGDHLGSASWITDYTGAPIQYIHYVPYGELIANQQMIGYDERYKFTGKERDAETGYDFFGARFYWQAGTWLSVDPLAGDYPQISPYAYAAWNPIRFIDPDGREITITGEDGVTITYVPGGKYEGNDSFTKNTYTRLNQLNDMFSNTDFMSSIVNSSDVYNISSETSIEGTHCFKDGVLYMGKDYSIDGIGHELFHAYQDTKGQGGASIHNEVEAYLFEAKIVYMVNNGLGSVPLTAAERQSSSTFSNALNTLIFDGFNQNAFNAVVSEFKTSSNANAGGLYNNYPLVRSNQTQSLIKQFYPIYL